MTFRPALLPPRPSSAAAGSDATLTGDARIARLAKPRNQLWERCAFEISYSKKVRVQYLNCTGQQLWERCAFILRR